jgi:hypothetical protein
VGPSERRHPHDAFDTIGDEWPTVKADLGKAVHLREVLGKAPWWN